MKDESTSIWDPIWEYVLNDYDEEDEIDHTKRKPKRNEKRNVQRNQLQAQVQAQAQSQAQSQSQSQSHSRSIFALFDEDDDDDDSNVRSSQKSRSKSVPRSTSSRSTTQSRSITPSRRRRKDDRDDHDAPESGWVWSSTKQPEQRENIKSSSRGHPWRRNKPESSQREPVQDVGSSPTMWDILGPGPDVLRSPSRNYKQETEQVARSQHSELGKGTKSQNFDKDKTLSQAFENGSEVKSQDSKDGKANTKKKGFFKRPFRKEEPQTPSINDKVELQRVESNRSSVSKQTSVKSKSSKRDPDEISKNQAVEDLFDPFSMIYEVAQTLDLVSQSDSCSTSSDTRTEQTDEKTNMTDEATNDGANSTSSVERANLSKRVSLSNAPQRNAPSTSLKSRSAQSSTIRSKTIPSNNFDTSSATANPPRNNTSPNNVIPVNPPDNFTEIRLKHTPSQANEVHTPYGEEEEDELGGSLQNDAPSEKFQDLRVLPGASRLLTDRQRSTGSFSSYKRNDSEDGEYFFRDTDFSVARDAAPSDECNIPPRIITGRSTAVSSMQIVGTYEPPKGLRRLTCCVQKDNFEGSIERTECNEEDVSEFFPTARMVSDDRSDVSSILGGRADFRNGIMGVASDRLLQSKGPQSLYGYDYKSNVHMDVCYSFFNPDPRSSIVCREHRSPPGPTSSDQVVVQVEVCMLEQFQNVCRSVDAHKPPFLHATGIYSFRYRLCHSTGRLVGA